ncbi:MAG: DoxX family protein [Mucilaginibacter sp.]
MNLIHRIEKWGDSHHPKFLDVIRVFLGIFLFLKGLGFMENSAYLKSLIESQPDIAFSSGWLMAAVYYVTFVHFVGGILIMLGIMTRVSALVQLPVVFCALLFINYLQSPFNTDLISSVAAFVLLIVFTVIGSGKWSVESYLESANDQDQSSILK